MKFSITNLLLFLIIIFFLFTRFYKIAEIPSSVYWDEASIGYNAFAISETGKDEWGKFLPIHFRAFGEFKLPVYIYTAVLSVKLFGFNEFSVRIPAVLFSLGVVVLVYFIARKLFNDVNLALLSSFFVSISPWFFIFSRTGYEATAGLFFYLLAVFFFLQYRKNYWYILFSVLSFVLSAYSYNSFRIIVPLSVLILAIYDWNLKSIFQRAFLPLIISVVILIAAIIPIYKIYRYDTGGSRLQAVGDVNSKLIGNYFSHFNPDFLFFSGDKNMRSQQAGFGQLYLPDLIFLPLGLFYMLKSKSKYRFLPLILLLLGPIPAAITKESPHALRAISMVPFFGLISAMGMVSLKKLFYGSSLVSFVVVAIFLVFFANYFYNFISFYPNQSLTAWQNGYKKIFTDFQDSFPKYDQILISDEYAQPYIFALFYQKIDPNQFRQTVIRNSIDQWGFSSVASFDKFKFGKINQLLKVNNSGSSLIFASKNEKINELNSISRISLLDGTDAFWVYIK